MVQPKRIFSINFFPDTWLSETCLLRPQEKGIYIHLIMLIFARQVGQIDDDDVKLARQCNCSLKLYQRVKQRLLGLRLIRVSQGQLIHDGSMLELDRALTRIHQAAAAGRRSGVARRKMALKKLFADEEDLFDGSSSFFKRV